jgi:hypothetical protein
MFALRNGNQTIRCSCLYRLLTSVLSLVLVNIVTSFRPSSFHPYSCSTPIRCHQPARRVGPVGPAGHFATRRHPTHLIHKGWPRVRIIPDAGFYTGRIKIGWILRSQPSPVRIRKHRLWQIFGGKVLTATSCRHSPSNTSFDLKTHRP